MFRLARLVRTGNAHNRSNLSTTATTSAPKRRPAATTTTTAGDGDGLAGLAGLREEISRREGARHNARETRPARGGDRVGGYTTAELAQYEPAIAQAGRIYSPEDLAFEAKRPLQAAARRGNVLDQFEHFQVEPLDQYKSSRLLSTFVTELGRIRTREQTGLSAKHQRQLGKAVRRARALTLLPTTARHPDAVQNNERRPRRMNWVARS